jgi:hypothetical protein
MTDESLQSLADHYRSLALDAYAAAELIEEPSEQLLMRQIGLGYDHLAANVEARTRAAELAASVGQDQTVRRS